MEQKTRVAIINKEIETFQKYIDFIPVMLNVCKKFDGKVINAKFEKALDEAANDGQTRENRICYISTGYSYNGKFEISVNIYDRNVTEKNNKTIYGSNYYIENDRRIFDFKKELFDITEAGNYRINASKMEERFNEIKEDIENSIELYKRDLTEVDAMIEEARELKKKFKKFEDKYSYHLRSVMGVNFSLRDNSGMGYTRYDL